MSTDVDAAGDAGAVAVTFRDGWAATATTGSLATRTLA